MIIVAVVLAVVYLVLQEPGGGGTPSTHALTITDGTTMTWTVYGQNANSSSEPFEIYIWNVTSISGPLITVNQTSYVIGTGTSTSQTLQVSGDDFRFGPSGITDAGLDVVGTDTISTPFGERNCTEFGGAATYLIYSVNVLLQQGTSNGVVYVSMIDVHTASTSLQISYVLTAGNVPEL
jgi:hypothetical protein